MYVFIVKCGEGQYPDRWRVYSTWSLEDHFYFLLKTKQTTVILAENDVKGLLGGGGWRL